MLLIFTISIKDNLFLNLDLYSKNYLIQLRIKLELKNQRWPQNDVWRYKSEVHDSYPSLPRPSLTATGSLSLSLSLALTNVPICLSFYLFLLFLVRILFVYKSQSVQPNAYLYLPPLRGKNKCLSLPLPPPFSCNLSLTISYSLCTYKQTPLSVNLCLCLSGACLPLSLVHLLDLWVVEKSSVSSLPHLPMSIYLSFSRPLYLCWCYLFLLFIIYFIPLYLYVLLHCRE